MLGGLCVSVDRQLMHGDLGTSGRRLAAYLFAFPNQYHRRERLCDLIWDSIDAERGRHALNTALWRLRQMLKVSAPDSTMNVISTAGEIALEARDPLLIDVHRFESAVKRCLPAIVSAPELGALQNAISGYHGPFMDGESDDWVLIERERLHCLYIRSLIELMHQYASTGSFEDALDCGRVVLSNDALRETVQRAVMLLYVLNGQRAEAIHQFDRCRTLLRDECDVEPMPQTVRLASLIQSGDVFNELETLSKSFFGEGMCVSDDSLAL